VEPLTHPSPKRYPNELQAKLVQKLYTSDDVCCFTYHQSV